MREFFQTEEGMTFLQLRDEVWKRFGKCVSAVRISVGLASNFADIFHFFTFARCLLDRTVEEVGPVESGAVLRGCWRDSA
jgi:hypothetical protein